MAPAPFERFTAVVLRWRWPLLVAVAALSVLFARELPSLRIDNSNENWLVEGDESLELIHKFNDLFGSDDFVYVLQRESDFFRAEPIHRASELAAALDAAVPHVLDTTWLGNAEFIEGRGDTIEIEELMLTLPERPAELARVRARALAEPVYLDNLISRDGSVAGLLLEMDAYPDDGVDPRKDIAPAVREVLARPEFAGLDLTAVGGPIFDYDLDKVAASEGQRLGLVCLVIQMAILFWVGRGLRGVVVPALLVVLSVVWTFGLVAIAGIELNAIVAMVPVLLICVGIGDAMHIISEFHYQQGLGLERRAALGRAMSLVGWACVLTSVTTAVGFLSFTVTPIRPYREMGLYAAAGVLVAVALSFVIVPILYSWGPARSQVRAREAGDVFDRLLRAAARLVTRRPLAVVLTFSALTAVALMGYARVRVETNPLEMFKPHVPSRQAMEAVDAEMGGSMSVEILLDTGERDGILDPVFLAELDALDAFVRGHPLTTKSTSILDVFRQMRMAFHENRPEFYGVPTGREEAAQYLLLYELSGGEDKAKLLPFENDIARLTARTRALSTADVERLFGDLQAYASEHLVGVATLEFTGMLNWVRSMTDLLEQGQRRSFAAALVAIGLVMMGVLRSVKLGLISMIPNVFPIFMTLGLLGWIGRPMDLMMMGFSALVIGVVVDDTIHFFLRFRREFERLGSYPGALEATLTTVGRPLTFTTMTLSLGFAALAASDMTGIGNFGVLAGFAFSWALLADFLFAPALMLLLKPLGPEREPALGPA